MKIIGHCSICGKPVTLNDSYSNKFKNIICVGCVDSITRSLGINEASYVRDYIHDDSNDCQKLFHAMTVVLNKAERMGDDSVNPFTIGLKCKDYLKEAYDLTDDEAMSIISQNIDKVNVSEIPLIY